MNVHGRGRTALGIVGVVTLATVLTACSGESEEAATEGGTTTVSVMQAPISAFAPVWIADELGYFADNGIELELQAPTTGTAAIGALTSGQVDVIATTVTEIIKAEAQGFSIKYLSNLEVYGDTDDTDQSGILVAVDSAIASPKDLEGTTIAVTGVNTQEDAKVKATIDADGGDSSTVEFVQSTPDAMAGLLETGQVDAISPPEPFIPGLIASGSFTRVSGANHIPLGGTPGLGLFVTADWLSENPSAAAGFQEAIAQAVEWANDSANADQLYEIIAAQLDSDVESVSAGVPTIFSTEVTTEQLDKTVAMLQTYGLVEGDFDPSSLLG